MKTSEATLTSKQKVQPRNQIWNRMVNDRYMYLLIIPGLLFFIIFKMLPMLGLLLAFQNYNPFGGIWGSEWIGLKHFQDLFSNTYFYVMLRNTLLINLFSLVFFFPVPIVLALMLNEVRHEVFKRIHQSIVYMPHFLSWVVIASLTFFILSRDIGVVNKILNELGFTQIAFLANQNYFWTIITLQNIWKDAGWGTIIFLAAMAAVDPSQYEAAVIDGASRWRQIWHVTLPAIRPTIIILLILRFGHLVDVGFEQLVLMINPLVKDVAEVFDTYAYTRGILQGNFSIGVTVGMFKGVVGLVLVLATNYIAKKRGYEGIY